MSLAEMLFVLEVSGLYHDLSKATEEDLRQLAEQAIKAAQVFHSVYSPKQ